MAYLCVVFSITGSSALYVVRGLLATVGVSASLFHGDALHRLLYLALMMPSYRYDSTLPITRTTQLCICVYHKLT
jgi:hypothetical protein